jgi:AmiR/NasT family two-component response regulator
VAITADATHGLDDRLIDAGAEAVEVKPLDLARLLARIDAALAG